MLGTLLEGLEMYEDYRIMILPDHPTPLALRTHKSDPVPYVIYDRNKDINNIKDKSISYDEFYAKETGIFIEQGHEIMKKFLLV